MTVTSRILMVRPAKFGYNAETAIDNVYQHAETGREVHEKAIEEFDNFVALLGKKAIEVTVIQDTIEPHTPDSIFPNNWASYHIDGTAIIYPMFAANRRDEKYKSVIDELRSRYEISQTIDLSHFESTEQYLEGTGSLVLDRDNAIAYACYSERTDRQLLENACALLDYQPVGFTAEDENGVPIYHTNVMMCVAESFAVVCLDSLPDDTEREVLEMTLLQTGKEVIPITLDQVRSFAGNMLQVAGVDGKRYLVMSDSAYNSLGADQISTIENHCEIIHAPLDTIEYVGGGSARCMMAEIFLPKK